MGTDCRPEKASCNTTTIWGLWKSNSLNFCWSVFRATFRCNTQTGSQGENNSRQDVTAGNNELILLTTIFYEAPLLSKNDIQHAKQPHWCYNLHMQSDKCWVAPKQITLFNLQYSLRFEKLFRVRTTDKVIKLESTERLTHKNNRI